MLSPVAWHMMRSLFSHADSHSVHQVSAQSVSPLQSLSSQSPQVAASHVPSGICHGAMTGMHSLRSKSHHIWIHVCVPDNAHTPSMFSGLQN